jgi:hypothetical protein
MMSSKPQQAADDALEHALTAVVLDHQEDERHGAGDHAADHQRKIEQQV